MNYLYTGPASGVTLADGKEILLWPNVTLELPEQHEYVKTLISLKYLVPTPTQEKTPTTKKEVSRDR